MANPETNNIFLKFFISLAYPPVRHVFWAALMEQAGVSLAGVYRSFAFSEMPQPPLIETSVENVLMSPSALPVSWSVPINFPNVEPELSIAVENLP